MGMIIAEHLKSPADTPDIGLFTSLNIHIGSNELSDTSSDLVSLIESLHDTIKARQNRNTGEVVTALYIILRDIFVERGAHLTSNDTGEVIAL